MATLFHFTCEHTHRVLGRQGQVDPLAVWNPEAAARLPDWWAWQTGLVWFTDLGHPDRWALGLTSEWTTYDRTVYRYRALETDWIHPWLEVLPTMPREARGLAAHGGLPRHWFVSFLSVRVELDQP